MKYQKNIKCIIIITIIFMKFSSSQETWNSCHQECLEQAECSNQEDSICSQLMNDSNFQIHVQQNGIQECYTFYNAYDMGTEENETLNQYHKQCLQAYIPTENNQNLQNYLQCQINCSENYVKQFVMSEAEVDDQNDQNEDENQQTPAQLCSQGCEIRLNCGKETDCYYQNLTPKKFVHRWIKLGIRDCQKWYQFQDVSVDVISSEIISSSYKKCIDKYLLNGPLQSGSNAYKYLQCISNCAEYYPMDSRLDNNQQILQFQDPNDSQQSQIDCQDIGKVCYQEILQCSYNCYKNLCDNNQCIGQDIQTNYLGILGNNYCEDYFEVKWTLNNINTLESIKGGFQNDFKQCFLFQITEFPENPEAQKYFECNIECSQLEKIEEDNKNQAFYFSFYKTMLFINLSLILFI